jgi:hypothetical protein
MSQREVLVKAVERIANILETRPQNLSGTFYVSSQQPFGDLAQPLWHYHRGKFIQLRQLALMFAPGGPLEILAHANGWLGEFERSQSSFDSAFKALNHIRYFGSEEPVELGDHVSLRVLFRKRVGRVSYLPGVSPENPDIDFGGLFRVGIDYGDGFVMCHVDIDSLDLKEGVTLLRRDPLAIPRVPSAEALNA